MEQVEQVSRAEGLARVRRVVAKAFPGATVTTNDDANPATPMAVTATWRRGTIIKAVRADSIRSTLEEFEARAISILTAFQTSNVPVRYQEDQTEA